MRKPKVESSAGVEHGALAPDPIEADNNIASALAAANAGTEAPKPRKLKKPVLADDDLDELATADFWGAFVAVPFDSLAVRRNFPEYRLTEPEKAYIGHPFSVIFKAVVKKYFRKNKELAAAAVAIVGLGQIIVSKEMAYTQWKKQNKPE
jgi:hypothetical protein